MFSFLPLLFSNTGIASSNSWELLEPEARLFFRQFVIIDGDESLLICHGLKRVDRCSFDHMKVVGPLDDYFSGGLCNLLQIQIEEILKLWSLNPPILKVPKSQKRLEDFYFSKTNIPNLRNFVIEGVACQPPSS